jgi:hypothetical protein
MMNMEVELIGADATEQTVRSLQDWVRNERIAGLRSELKTNPPKPGEMGAEISTILSVIASGSGKAVDLAKSVYNWLQTFKPKLVVKIKSGPNVVEVKAESLPDIDKVVAAILKMTAAQGG